MIRGILIIYTAFLVIFNAGFVCADEIMLENGDRLTGTVTGLEKGVLTFATDYSEPVKIKTSKIKTIRTSESKAVHLKSGEILKGRMTTDEGGGLTIGQSGERGETVTAWDNVASVNPPAVKPVKWKGSANLGANFQDGNTNRMNISAGADAARRTAKDRYKLRFQYNYGEEEQEVTARSYYGETKYDYFFTKAVYGYLSVELLKDKFKDLRLRTVTGPGVGYQFWDDETRSLLLEAGLSYFSEDLKEGEDKDWITARLAGDLRYRFAGTLEFADQLIVYPSLEKGSDYKLRNEASLTSPLVSGWSLKLANILEHDGNPPEGVERNDWHWILALQYSFN